MKKLIKIKFQSIKSEELDWVCINLQINVMKETEKIENKNNVMCMPLYV